MSAFIIITPTVKSVTYFEYRQRQVSHLLSFFAHCPALMLSSSIGGHKRGREEEDSEHVDREEKEVSTDSSPNTESTESGSPSKKKKDAVPLLPNPSISSSSSSISNLPLEIKRAEFENLPLMKLAEMLKARLTDPESLKIMQEMETRIRVMSEPKDNTAVQISRLSQDVAEIVRTVQALQTMARTQPPQPAAIPKPVHAHPANPIVAAPPKQAWRLGDQKDWQKILSGGKKRCRQAQSSCRIKLAAQARIKKRAEHEKREKQRAFNFVVSGLAQEPTNESALEILCDCGVIEEKDKKDFKLMSKFLPNREYPDNNNKRYMMIIQCKDSKTRDKIIQESKKLGIAREIRYRFFADKSSAERARDKEVRERRFLAQEARGNWNMERRHL